MVQIANVGDYGLRVYNPISRQHLILPVEVALNGASFLVTVGKEAEQPPYRIENRQGSQTGLGIPNKRPPFQCLG